MTFGNVLRVLRTRNNMTQKQLAVTLGVSESRIGMYERCQREPDFEMLETIADYFNVDMDYLTGRTDVERQYTCSPSGSLTPTLTLSLDETQLVKDYREATPEIRAAAATMLHNSADANRKDGSSSAANAG